jgi:uncharacterized membrane protein
VTNPARTLVAVAILAVVVALAVALAGAVVYRATLRDAPTRLQPAGIRSSAGR